MKRTYLVLIITMLIVGFAAVTTSLVINGSISIGFNEDEFNVYFSYANIDYVEKEDIISQDKKTITFVSSKLTSVGDNSVLTYDVTNESRQYNAKVKVTCEQGKELYSIENSLNQEEIIEARSTKTGKLTVTLNDVVTEDQDITFACNLEVTAVSRSEEKTNEIPFICHYPKNFEWDFDYTNGEQEFKVPCDGTYKLEVWGAQGGVGGQNIEIKKKGGLGGYSKGNITLESNEVLYINVGGQGEATMPPSHENLGGYNGGGTGYINNNPAGQYGGFGGGGATHIALTTGLLSTLEQKQDQILIVAGGGGGNSSNDDINPGETTRYYSLGGSGGGFKGQNGINSHTPHTSYYGTGGTQENGGNNSEKADEATGKGVFGLGGNYLVTYEYGSGSGGGGGYYGGGSSSRHHAGAGGGSGYIGNSLLTDKGMWCYQCETSDDEETKTTSTENVSAEPVSEYAKQGNGYAKITLVSLEN